MNRGFLIAKRLAQIIQVCERGGDLHLASWLR
ncbi:hypothetical protein PsAD37_01870 [Pseudovibrio sp. Ad37]|nr:hypothetical protein PsAD37_01870 [Pseudovibrio sp. Ad37]